MASEPTATSVFTAMSSPPTTGNGLFNVIDITGPYSANLKAIDCVGTATTPYLRSHNPAYIPVLYHNVGRINDTLTNVVGTTALANNATTITDLIGATPLATDATTITGLIGGTALVSGGTITGLIGSSPITGTITNNISTITGIIGTTALATNATTITDLIGATPLATDATTITGLIGDTALVSGGTITGLIGSSLINGTITNNISTINTSITNINTSIGTTNITGISITAAIATLQIASSTGSSGCSTQVLGTTTINGIVSTDNYNVDVVSNTTVISSISAGSKSVRARYTYTNESSIITDNTSIAIYEMGAYDIREFGCSKTVMFTAADWVNVSGVTKIDLGQLAFLYAGTGNYFLVNGSKQNFYQFLFIGDFVTFQMLTTDGSTWQFVATHYNDTFSTTINTVTAATITGGLDESLFKTK